MMKSWISFVSMSDQELLRLVRVDVFKGSGRGGQKRNKTSNAVRLTLESISVTDNTSRSKEENTRHALKKLRLAIALDTSGRFSRNCDLTSISGLNSYIKGGIIRINASNPQLVPFLGVIVDQLMIHKGNWKEVAAHFQVSVSQLRKFAGKHPRLLEKTKNLQFSEVSSGDG